MKKYIRRIIGGLCIATSLIVASIPSVLLEASNAREDYLLDNNILVDYTGTASTVSVSNEVKYIGEEAFANNSNIISVDLGKNVKEIRHGAFANCNNLKKVVIPASVEKIEAAAFSGCNSLINVSLGKNVFEVGDAAFSGCKKLGGISIPKGNDKFRFEAGVLYDKDKEKIFSYLMANPYEIYYMPNSVSNISPYSFWGNESLKEVYLSSSLPEVPAYSFSNCKNLKLVQIPYSVNSIDAKAFENCVSLKDVVIPASVTYIDPTAFDGCYNLNIIADEGTAAYEFFEKFDLSDASKSEMMDTDNVIKGDNTETKKDNKVDIGSGLVDASNDPSNVDWMPSVNPIISPDDSSVFGKTIVVNGRAVFLINREMNLNTISNDTSLEPSKNLDSIRSENENASETDLIYDSEKGGYLPKYTYINNKIASHAFYASNNNDDFIIPSDIKKIGRFAFARSTVSDITIPEGVDEIGYGAFYHCDNLNNVSIPSTVKKIDGHVFDNTPFLKSIKNNSSQDYYIVGDGILLAYSGQDTHLSIPEGVKSISPGCFENMRAIESVILPSSLVTVGADAFRGCSSLRAVVGGDKLENICDRAFMGCPIGGYIVPASVKSIGLRAFDFSDTSLKPEEKVVIFSGNSLPKVEYDETSSRLSNYDYRKDSLYNVLFAVVNNGIADFDDTVLDNDTLGFSGVILNNDGNGTVSVVDSYIYSEEILPQLPDSIVLDNKKIDIKDFNEIKLATNPYLIQNKNTKIDIHTDLNNKNNINAVFSNDEAVGYVNISTDENASIILNNAYANLFGGETINNLEAYNISLIDDKGVVKINRLGKTVLYITVPVAGGNERYHVITFDEDKQLEELPCSYDSNNKSVTFQTTHLSYFGIYNSNNDVVLNLKDGKLVKDYKLDSSPDTGDKSISIFYIASVGIAAIGIWLILYKKKYMIS